MVLSYDASYFESSPGSSDECRMAPSGWRPSDQSNLQAVSPPVGCYHRHLLLLCPKADTHFTVSQRVEGWVDLGKQGVRNLPKVFTQQRPGRELTETLVRRSTMPPVYSNVIAMNTPVSKESYKGCHSGILYGPDTRHVAYPTVSDIKHWLQRCHSLLSAACCCKVLFFIAT